MLVGALTKSNDTHAERTPNLKGNDRGFRMMEGRDAVKGNGRGFRKKGRQRFCISRKEGKKVR